MPQTSPPLYYLAGFPFASADRCLHRNDKIPSTHITEPPVTHHKPDPPQPTPDPLGLQIATALQDAVNPARIILYGSRAARNPWPN